MAIDFNDPNTTNAFAMALGMIGQAFAQNPQQAALAGQAVKLAQGQQRSNLLGNLLKPATTPAAAGTQQGAGYASKLQPSEIDQAPSATAAGLQQPTGGAIQNTGLSPIQANILTTLLGGGQTPFGLTQRR